MRPRLGVFLLSHKRPLLIQATIESLLVQDYHDFRLIISENTPDDSVITVLEKYQTDPRVVIVKREPMLASLHHFGTIIQEATQYPYAMFFHDDDILKSTALSSLMNALESHPDCAAAACNAVFIKEDVLTTQKYNAQLNQDVKIQSQRQLILRYIFKTLGHVPFPFYIYRTQFLKNLNLNSADGGKYSDTSFLIKLVKRAPLYWIAEPLMEYRLHAGNDSAHLNLKDIGSLCLFYLKVCPELFIFIGFYYFKQFVKKMLM